MPNYVHSVHSVHSVHYVELSINDLQERIIKECISLLFAILLFLRGTYSATFYGDGTDGYLGEHPAAYWHSELPPGAPNVVDDSYYGVAINGIPFGTVLELEVVGVPSWADEGELDIVGNKVTVTVWDRVSVDGLFDLTPAAARELMGEEWQRIGRVTVKVRLVEDLCGLGSDDSSSMAIGGIIRGRRR